MLAFVLAATAFVASTTVHAQTLSWATDTVATGLTAPTRCAFGPDGRLYVLEITGRITIYTLGRDHKPTAVQVVQGFSNDPNGIAWTCLGLGFDPLDHPDSVRVYVGRTMVYQPASTGAYVGRLSKFTGPNFDKPVDVITGLPVSRFDHATNGFVFGNDGNLYLQQGGNTNAGITGPGLTGNRDEGPLSGSTLIAYVRRPAFNGRITYSNPEPGLATQTGGFDVQVWAPGMRNPYGIAQHSNGYLYGTDNGPNSWFNTGTQWSCDSVGPPIDNQDKLDLIEQGHYYGHPNRGRAATDPRQCFYHNPTDGPVNGFTPPMRVINSSSDGILEYRARTFGGAMRGDLLVSRYEQDLSRAQLSADGRSVLTYTQGFPLFASLDICAGPDGTVYGVSYDGGTVSFMAPVETPPAHGPRVLTLWPERGPATEARTARLTGYRLGLAGTPTVKLAGSALAVSAFDSASVTVTIPPGGTAGWKDLVVSTAEGADTLTRAWCVIRPNLTDGDSTPPLIDIVEPEKRYYDRATPSLTVLAHDRLGLDSLRVSFDGGAFQVLVASCPDTSFAATVTVPQALWAAAAPGLHHVVLVARDDAHNLTSVDWAWNRTLPASGFVRINSGGARTQDPAGWWFSSDSAFTGGTALSVGGNLGTQSLPTLDQDARVSLAAQHVRYQLLVPSRAYALRLEFAELDTASVCVGCRVQDVLAEGDTVIAKLDLSSTGLYQPLERDAEAVVVDGALNLDFAPRHGGALVSAWSAYPLGLDDVTPPQITAIPQAPGVIFDNPPTVSLVANDPNDGELFACFYSMDGGALQPAVRQLRKPSISTAWTLPTAAFTALTGGMHNLQLHAVDLAGHIASTPTWSFGRSGLVGVGDPALALAPMLRVWPNPAGATPLRVHFVQPRAGLAHLRVFDIAGREVVHRELGWRLAGANETALDLGSEHLTAGLYFLRVSAPGLERTERIARLP